MAIPRNIARLALALAAALPLAAAAAPVAKQTAQVPGFYRMALGDFEVTALYDGYVDLDPAQLKGASAEDIQSLLARMFVESSKGVQTAVNAYLINTGSQLVLVDTGAELSWIPAEILESLRIERRNQWRFRQADGTVLERWSGPAFVYAAGRTTTDEVVFGGPADLVLLGARSLEGLNLRVDPLSKQLVDAGPAPAAVVLPRPY